MIPEALAQLEALADAGKAADIGFAGDAGAVRNALEGLIAGTDVVVQPEAGRVGGDEPAIHR